MRNRAGGYVLGISLLLAACSDTTGGSSLGQGAESSASTGTNTAPRTTHSQQPSASTAPSTDLSSQDIRALPSTHVGAGIPLGPPPRIPWSEPVGNGPRVIHPAVNPVDDAPQLAVRLRRPDTAPRNSNCWSLVDRDDAGSLWTRCYLWGRRPADGLYRPVLSPDGRWAVDLIFTGGTVQLDTRTGRAVSRTRFAGRAQQVAFEDRDHYLVVLTAETAADAFPIEQWIVRCDVRGSCERAINVVLIDEYSTLGFVRSRP
jgi:hypothetical protein